MDAATRCGQWYYGIVKRSDRLAIARALVEIYTQDELKTKLKEALEMGASGRASS